MADNKDKKDLPAQAGDIKIPEKRSSPLERAGGFRREQERVPEKREIPRDDAIVSAELRREIEMMQLDDSTKQEAEKQAEKIDFLGEKEKIEHLLDIARKKGLVFAIQVARKMNEPYLLDILHDTLAREGFYKDFVNPKKDDDNADDPSMGSAGSPQASSGQAKKT